MPRAPRADEAGGLYHALNRGNLRADIFLKEAEFAAFERILHEGLEIHQIELYSYQLISNHYHLVLQPLVDGEMSRFMSWIGGTHTMRYHPTRNDARYPRLVTVYYPLHPLFGRENLPVRQRSGATSVAQVVIECEQQCQAVPLWMTDQQRCSAMTIGFDPQCALSSLLALTSLIDAAGL